MLDIIQYNENTSSFIEIYFSSKYWLMKLHIKSIRLVLLQLYLSISIQ